MAKHARATHVAVTLAYEPTAVRLRIRDDGVGFDVAALQPRPSAAAPWSGFGLLGMRERLTALRGTLTLTSSDGAQVEATVPRPDVPGAPALSDSPPASVVSGVAASAPGSLPPATEVQASADVPGMAAAAGAAASQP